MSSHFDRCYDSKASQRAQLKINSETYDGFLYDPETGEPLDAESFCNRFVDPVGVEAGEQPGPSSGRLT